MNETNEIIIERKEAVSEPSWKTEIIYFSSPWCVACKHQSSIIAELKKELDWYEFIEKDVSVESWMQAALDECIGATPTIIVRYSYQAMKKNKWFIDRVFVWVTPAEDIINYIKKW